MDISKILEAIKGMKVTELNELIKAIEEEFGVTAAAPMAAAAEATGSSEKTVKLVNVGSTKIAVIKVVRELKGLGLMEAKKFVEELPAIIEEEASEDRVKELTDLFVAAGAEVSAE